MEIKKLAVYFLFAAFIPPPACSSQQYKLKNILKEDKEVEEKEVGAYFNKTMKLVPISSGDTLTMDMLAKKDERLFFFFEYSNCNECISRMLEYFAEHSLYNLTIMACASDYSTHDIFALKEYYRLKEEIYLVKKNDLAGFRSFNLNKPVFFTISEDCRINTLYFVNYSLLGNVAKYLDNFKE